MAGVDSRSAPMGRRGRLAGGARGFDLALASAAPGALAEFYADVLGGAPCEDASPWSAERAVGFGRQVVAVRRAAESSRSSPKGIYDAIGLRVVALVVADVDAACERIEATGRRVAKGVDLPGHGPVRFARDPDGNTLELIGARGVVPTHPLQVGLTVCDAAASCDFYERVLGLPAQPKAPISKGVTRHGFDVGSATLKLWQPLGDTGALPRAIRGAIGIDAVLLRGGDVARAAHALEDPDGNRIEWAPLRGT